MRKMISLFGLDARLRRIRILAFEAALAAGDRGRLLRLAWHDEQHRLRRLAGLLVAVAGLTTVVAALLSIAVVVQFWDTPHRRLVAWLVAVLWIAIWAVAAAALLGLMRRPSESLGPALEELGRDIRWLKEGLAVRPEAEPIAPGPGAGHSTTPTRSELHARIAAQRARISTLSMADAEYSGSAKRPADASLGATAWRIGRKHPVVTGVAATAIVAVLGPKRLMRWVAVVVPIAMRTRSAR